MTNLECLRRKQKLSQHLLAKKSGVPQPIICMIESGKTKNPRVDTLLKLSETLGCEIGDLIRKQ